MSKLPICHKEGREMGRKVVSEVMLTLLLMGMLVLAFNIQSVEASGTIFIRADGSIDPDTAPILSLDNVTYTLSANINDAIVVERDNIIVDGAGYALWRTGSGVGISIYYRSNVTVKNVEIDDFMGGMWIYRSSNLIISGNTVIDNGDGIGLFFCSNVLISGNNIIDNGRYGIELGGCSNITITGNNITTDHWTGIEVRWSSDNTVHGNNIENNDWFGILIGQSHNNTVSGNDIRNNTCGINLSFSSINTISENDISANRWWGILACGGSDNRIYHNNFDVNLIQAYAYESSINAWDEGYPSGGNYWSDYNGTDLYSGSCQNETGSDGIGDTPYIVEENNQDNYPLMEPWTPKPLTPIEASAELIETIQAYNLTEGTENSLSSKLEDAIHLLKKGNENGAIHKLMDFIDQVEGLQGKKLTDEQADYLISEAQRIIDLIQG